MPDLVRFYCKNCRLDTTIAVGQIRSCPRCHCGVSLNELYPGQIKLGMPYFGPNQLKAAPTFEAGVNQRQDQRNSGKRLNYPKYGM